jgi:cell division protein FtsL
MTIIRPNKNKSPWNSAVIVLGSGILCCFALTIFLYSRAVSLKHETEQMEDKISEARLKNAELKSALFHLTDLEDLEKLAAEKGLIKDKNPQWAFVSP